jgi:murein DD-endopeptidase MepM/ murein hydrolase activator NlpD
MSFLLTILLASVSSAEDCSQQGGCSLMDLLHDMERANQTRAEELDEVVEPVEAETPVAPVAPVQPVAPRAYVSSQADYAPRQTAAAGIPSGSGSIRWRSPSAYTVLGHFSGSPGRKADHEGVDHVHDDRGAAEVPVVAMADGEVVYVRLGCPQSSAFGVNALSRECGSGWGNHVIVEHADGVYVRYGHLDPSGVSVGVGDTVQQGQQLGLMGNSGRSQVRHLHYELGTKAGGFDPEAPSQSFDAVYDPHMLPSR